jgi:hypothetical protein
MSMKPMKSSYLGLILLTLLAAVPASRGNPPQIGEGVQWGNYSYKKLTAPVELELVRKGETIDTIAIAQGTVVSTETTETGEVKAYWMGETFTVPENIVTDIHKDPSTAKDKAVAPMPELQTSKGILTNVTLNKEYGTSVMIRHDQGSAFVDKVDLSDDAQIKLGLKDAPAETVKLKTSDGWHTTLARTTAFLNRNPFLSKPKREPKARKFHKHLKREHFEGWPLEEMLWYNQKARSNDGMWKAPMEIGQEATMDSQKPDYYGTNYEKLYQVSLRPQLEKLGIKALQQTGKNCGLFAGSNLLIASLKLAGKPCYMGPYDMAKFFANTTGKNASEDSQEKFIMMYAYRRLPAAIHSTPIQRRNVAIGNGSYDIPEGSREREPRYWMRKALMGPRDGIPLDNELILHELRSGRPVQIGMFFFTKDGLGYPHAGLIVGARILRPQPDLVVEYEWLNSHGPGYGDKGYGTIADDGVNEAYSVSFE